MYAIVECFVSHAPHVYNEVLTKQFKIVTTATHGTANHMTSLAHHSCAAPTAWSGLNRTNRRSRVSIAGTPPWAAV
jgi:hypothetical protein